MLFNSYIFIFIFFPLCITGFYLLTNVDNPLYAKLWLIGFSLWFYGYFNIYYLAIMILSILINHALTIWIRVENGQGTGLRRKLPLITGVVINLGVLFYFKYFDFFLTAVNDVFGSSLPLKNIVLPLGISFFTFQQIGFLADVYHGEVPETGFVDYALFVSFFPQLIAGPIVSQEEMLPQFQTIKGRKADFEKISRGLTLFLFGLAKKVLIADTFGAAVDTGYSSLAVMGGLDSFLLMIWYSLQLYFDFSGYCDMARGLGQMLGFEIPVNFNSPYISADIVEFWKRWHITLTRFFTKYVYIPLGGNRKGEARMLLNILIIYFLSGLWHGAGYNYIFWGMLHGILYVLTRIWTRHISAGFSRPMGAESGHESPVIMVKNKITHAIKKLLTFLYVSFAWIYFRADDIAQGNELVRHIFTGSWRSVSYSLSEEFKLPELWYGVKVLHIDRNYLLSQNLLMVLITVFALGLIFFAPNAASLSEKIRPKKRYAFLLALLGVWCVLTLSQVSTFLYFNF